jgi:hypothetical protein
MRTMSFVAATSLLILIGMRAEASGLAGCAGADRAASVDILVIDHDARVPGTVLARAADKVTRVLQAIPIEAEWHYPPRRQGSVEDAAADSWNPDKNTLTLHVHRTAAVLRDTRAGDVLGTTPRTADERGHLAYLFYDRIALLASINSVDEAQFLGYVMAHEIGHMLLPVPDAHTDVGLMRSGVDAQPLWTLVYSVPQFSAEQVDLLRAMPCRQEM